jgi:hypothetical protein
MEWLPSILPVTVVAAITLFVLKEVLEFIKRWRADRRKGQAYRKVLARECELNLWAQWRLKETLREINHCRCCKSFGPSGIYRTTGIGAAGPQRFYGHREAEDARRRCDHDEALR